MDKKTSPIARACAALGSQANLARALGVTTSAVTQWVSGRRPVPATHARRIEDFTGGAVGRLELCPDEGAILWPELAKRQAKLAKRQAKLAQQEAKQEAVPC
jgi:DNA-binding transcriptional regulator YdaS (Cro superfamily)